MEKGRWKGTTAEWILPTCTMRRSRIAKLLIALRHAVEMESVWGERGGGEDECRGGPSCSSIAYSSRSRPTSSVSRRTEVSEVGSSLFSENTSSTLSVRDEGRSQERA